MLYIICYISQLYIYNQKKKWQWLKNIEAVSLSCKRSPEVGCRADLATPISSKDHPSIPLFLLCHPHHKAADLKVHPRINTVAHIPAIISAVQAGGRKNQRKKRRNLPPLSYRFFPGVSRTLLCISNY